jgi:RNA polymerase sigma factor (sigma-70 family)
VIAVAGNLAVDQLRRQQRKAAGGRNQPAGPIETVELRVDLQRALAQLPRRHRQVAILRYFSDLSEADIASELGCSPGTVKQHASRALARLRRILHSR